MSDLQSLLERLKGDEAHLDRRLSYDLLRALLGRNGCHAWLYGAQKGNPHSSIDAALALVERVLPGIWYWVGRGKNSPTEPLYGALLMFGEEEIGGGEHEHSAPLAIMIALLQALIASKSPSEP